jgi:hypothetical protein
MRKLIILHITDHNPDDKKLSAKDTFSAMKVIRDASFKEFRGEVKNSPFTIFIRSEHEVKPEVIIEYDDAINEAVVNWLRKVSIVEVIDSIIQ